jgi:hypothetical protein
MQKTKIFTIFLFYLENFKKFNTPRLKKHYKGY